ncbi:hypothetical protein TNCV_2601281 [Trichonephila clavipes]|nr:hypothetical protein TNCV_2601281 [Trichonephila clavipes]
MPNNLLPLTDDEVDIRAGAIISSPHNVEYFEFHQVRDYSRDFGDGPRHSEPPREKNEYDTRAGIPFSKLPHHGNEGAFSIHTSIR